MKTKLFIANLLYLVFGYASFDLKAQVLYTLCGSQKGIKYQVTGKPGSIFHWTVEGGQIISDFQGSNIMVNWDNKGGDYTISVFEETESGCLGNTMKATVRINPSPVIDLGKTKTICEGEQIELNPGTGFSNYLWQDGSSNPVYITKGAGTYWVKVTNEKGCSFLDSIVVLVAPLPMINLGKGIMVCAPDELVLDAKNSGALYNWSNGSTTQTILAHEGDGQIWVRVTDANGCVGGDTVQILKCVKKQQLEIANAFTPNGDGHNDYWQMEGVQNYPSMTVKVYDRWGIEVFSSEHGYAKPWDGTSNGKKMPTGAYYYVINLGDGSNEITGSITLIR